MNCAGSIYIFGNIYICNNKERNRCQAAEVAQQLRALIALVEDICLIPQTCMIAHNQP